MNSTFKENWSARSNRPVKAFSTVTIEFASPHALSLLKRTNSTMVSSGFTLTTLALAVATVSQTTEAHGYIAVPMSAFPGGVTFTWVDQSTSL